MKLLKWLGIGALGLVVLLVLVGIFADPPKPTQAASQAQPEAQAAPAAPEAKAPEPKAIESVTAVQFAKAYDENTVAADQRFKGIEFKVSGKITDINTDFLGKPYVGLKGINDFMSPQFSFDDSVDKNVIAALKKGAQLTLICTGKGDIAKTAMAGDCRPAD